MARYSDRGRRPSNQDAVLVRHWPDGRAVLAVADGMGGHSAGEVAANRALEVLAAALDAGVGLREAIRTANAAVLAEGRSAPDLMGMGTTVVALFLQDGQYHVANVGDSRAYRIDRAGITQITRDHSFVAEAVSSGELSAEEAVRSPWRNALTRSIGAEADVDVDVFGPYSADDPHIVLLCSDGLYRALPDARIRDEVLGSADLDSAIRLLGGLALEHGSDDNVSLAAIRFGVPRAAGAPDRDAGGVATRREEAPAPATAAPRVEAPAAAARAASWHAADEPALDEPAPAEPESPRLDAWGMPWPGDGREAADRTGTFMFQAPRPEPRWNRMQIALALTLLAALLGYLALLALMP